MGSVEERTCISTLSRSSLPPPFHILAKGPKSRNFRNGNFNAQKTFWTKCVNFFSQQNSVQILFATKIHKTICNLMSTKSKECMFFSVTFPPSKIFEDCLENYVTIKGFSGSTKTFQIPDYPETFQIMWKLSRPIGNFPECPETFQFIWKLSRLSENFSDYPEIF